MFVKKEGFDSVSRRVLDLQTTSDLRKCSTSTSCIYCVCHRRCHFFNLHRTREKSQVQKKAPKKFTQTNLWLIATPCETWSPHDLPDFPCHLNSPKSVFFLGGEGIRLKRHGLLYNEWFITLLGTNISHQKSLLKMMFLFPRWDMLVPWRVVNEVILKMISFEWRRTPRHFLKPQELFIQKIWAFWHIGIFEPRNKPPYFPLYWLFNRDPYGWS